MSDCTEEDRDNKIPVDPTDTALMKALKMLDPSFLELLGTEDVNATRESDGKNALMVGLTISDGMPCEDDDLLNDYCCLLIKHPEID